MELNNVNPQMFRLTTGNLVAEINESFSFIAANIFTHVILELLQDVSRVLTDEGVLVCSGIIAENKQFVISAIENLGFEILETAAKDEWVAIVGRHKGIEGGSGTRRRPIGRDYAAAKDAECGKIRKD